jgi:ABC-2 type transport system ATP-binding protein
VRAGEAVVLVGPNGAGKSTLLRILATTVLPDRGTAHVLGHDVVRQAPAVRRSVGLMLGDERSWYWRLSGRRNLEFFAVLHGLSRRAASERATELLDDVGLSDAADRRFDGYSSGMKARLSLARALISDPPVLLLDEPTRNLDPVASRDFRERTLAIAHASGATVVMVTHDLHEAAEIDARVVALVGGEVAFERDAPLADELEDALAAATR